MSVKYNLVMESGAKIPLSYMCFGLLNRLDSLSSSNVDVRGHAERSAAWEQYDLSKLEYVEFKWKAYVDECVRSESRDAAYIEVIRSFKELFSELRMYRNCVTFLVKDGLVRVKVKDQPADKVISCLIIARNLTSEVARDFHAEHKRGYQWARGKNLSPLEALIFSEYFYIRVERNWRNPTEVQATFSHRFNDESSVINCATFGHNALVAFLKQEDDYAPWYQDTFVGNGNGYMRDGHFCEEGIMFRDFDQDLADEDGDIDWDYSIEGSHGNALYRKMNDCFSIQGDVPLFGMSDDEVAGFYYPSSQQRNESDLMQHLAQFRSVIESIQ